MCIYNMVDFLIRLIALHVAYSSCIPMALNMKYPLNKIMNDVFAVSIPRIIHPMLPINEM